MPFTKCSQCGESFHLKLISEKALNQLHEKEKNGEALCLECFKKKQLKGSQRPNDKNK